MEQFTASEVRELAATIWPDLSGREEVAETLNAFADMLEAQEKAEAIGFLSRGALAALVDCRSDDYNGNVDLWMRSNDAVKATIPVYTRPSPSDAERLAEALRQFRAYAVRCETCHDHIRVDHPAYREVDEALAAHDAHSAQAQPPAASVTDTTCVWVEDNDGYCYYEHKLDQITQEIAAQENPND